METPLKLNSILFFKKMCGSDWYMRMDTFKVAKSSSSNLMARDQWSILISECRTSGYCSKGAKLPSEIMSNVFGTQSRLKHSGWRPHQTSLWLIFGNSTFGLLLVALCVQNVFTTCSPGVHQVFTTLQNTSFEGSSVNWQQNFHSQLAGTNNWRFPQYFLDPPTEFWLLFRVF